jgi:hypothetical protein
LSPPLLANQIPNIEQVRSRDAHQNPKRHEAELFRRQFVTAFCRINSTRASAAAAASAAARRDIPGGSPSPARRPTPLYLPTVGIARRTRRAGTMTRQSTHATTKPDMNRALAVRIGGMGAHLLTPAERFALISPLVYLRCIFLDGFVGFYWSGGNVESRSYGVSAWGTS